MIRWPWLPIALKKLAARLVVRSIEGVRIDRTAAEGVRMMTVEVRWKGPRIATLSSLRRKVRRNCTKEEELTEENGRVVWNEEFESTVRLTAQKENLFIPWVIEFVVFYGGKQVPKNKSSFVGMASLNLAEYASSSGEEFELNLPLLMASFNADSSPMLHLTLELLELRRSPDSPEIMQRHVAPSGLSPPLGDASLREKDEVSALKAGLRKVKMLTEFVSTRKSKKSSRRNESSDGEDAYYPYQFDTDSLDDNPNEEIIRNSLGYGALATANCVDGIFYCDSSSNGEYEDCVYRSYRRSDIEYSPSEEMASSVAKQPIKRSILSWRKRKYSLRSPKVKGEPLLKKAYGEDGGDDIDYDRRQLTSSDESFFGMEQKGDDDRSVSVSDFGDDTFAVGSWEAKKLVSRDGNMKLSTEVFFASIDQRSERADGQSACTALVAIIADWFNSSNGALPIKSQLDSLIREGSLEWRNLCENQMYRERFPDKHFDLETIIQAKIRPLSVVPGKSFVGFFSPEGCEDTDCGGFEFLDCAMSFDGIWDEISQAGSGGLYIVSWNDHFFVLKVELNACYIIDTLGERLYEGCDQAYILKFDDSTTIHRISNPVSEAGEEGGEAPLNGGGEELVCRGKESCKEYIKSFLAAIPIRELQADIRKGCVASLPLHRLLQIEFHYTEAEAETKTDGIASPAAASPLSSRGSASADQSPENVPA